MHFRLKVPFLGSSTSYAGWLLLLYTLQNWSSFHASCRRLEGVGSGRSRQGSLLDSETSSWFCELALQYIEIARLDPWSGHRGLVLSKPTSLSAPRQFVARTAFRVLLAQLHLALLEVGLPTIAIWAVSTKLAKICSILARETWLEMSITSLLFVFCPWFLVYAFYAESG